MRAEERHKLQQNELSARLAKWIEKAKPYGNAVLLGVLLVILAVLAYVWWNRQSTEQAVAAWAGVYQGLTTGDPESFEKAAALNPDSQAADWATLLAGDVYLGNACQQLFENKSKAIDNLQEAIRHYEDVQQQSPEAALRERATFGLARAYEALAGTEASGGGSADGGSSQFKGPREKAIEQYEKLLDEWPNGPYVQMAARRVEELNREDIKEFYDKFATDFDPQPAAADIPGVTGERPPFSLNSLSDDPTGLPALPDMPPAEFEGDAIPEDEVAPSAEGHETGAEPIEGMELPGPALPGTLPITPAEPPADSEQAAPKTPEAEPGPTEKALPEEPAAKTEPAASKPGEAKEPGEAP